MGAIHLNCQFLSVAGLGHCTKANKADYREEKQVWKAIVLIDITLITKTPAPRQKLFHGFFLPWGCCGVIPGKGKIGGIS